MASNGVVKRLASDMWVPRSSSWKGPRNVRGDDVEYRKDGGEGMRRLPARRVLTNNDLARMVGTSDSWIAERTGIRERRIAAEGELTSSMGACAAARARRCGARARGRRSHHARDLDPDQTFPATAVTIQARLGITHGAAFDVQASARASSLRSPPPTTT